jgi:hypothetical protein
VHHLACGTAIGVVESMESDSGAWEGVGVPAEVLHTQDHERHGAQAFLRLELTEDDVIVVVHEVGPRHVREDSDESRDRWHAWQQQLEPPTLSDDAGTTYRPSRTRRAVGPGGGPSAHPTPMKATVFWHFLPPPRPEVRRWTINGRWTVERPGR